MKNEAVVLANKEFYDKTASVYDLADGRRSPKLENWLSLKLKKLAENYGNKNFLDLGCGTGFVMKCARKYFLNVIGLDISKKILKKANQYGKTVCADINNLPFTKEKFNVVTSFATLHHCVELKRVFEQVYKVLKKGGCFYSDHDMEKNFYNKFKLPLLIYRNLRNPAKRYFNLAKNLDKSLYEKSEYQKDGLPAMQIKNYLKEIGFAKIKQNYHWFGLNPLTDFIFKQKNYSLGYAPLLSIEAVK